MSIVDYALESCSHAYRIDPKNNMYSNDHCVGCKLKVESNPELRRGSLTAKEGLCRGMILIDEPIPNSKNIRMRFEEDSKAIQDCPDRPKITLETALESN